MKKKTILKNQILKSKSIIHWENEFQKVDPNGAKRLMINISCGKCGNIRAWRKDIVLKRLKTGIFTGVCKNCYRFLTWEEKNRNRPLQRKPTNHGYIKIFLGKHHPMADKRGEIYEHRFVMSKSLDRPLETWEHVHHKDGNKTNNSLENLELHPNSEHYTIRKMKNYIFKLESILIAHNIQLPHH